MSRRAINLTIIVLGILLLNGLAFAGAGRTESLLDVNQPSSRLESNTSNHRSAAEPQVQACLPDQTLAAQTVEPVQGATLAQQAAPGESVVATAATTSTNSDCAQD